MYMHVVQVHFTLYRPLLKQFKILRSSFFVMFEITCFYKRINIYSLKMRYNQYNKYSKFKYYKHISP